MALGNNVKHLRVLRGWDQHELFKASGVPVGTISAMEVRNSKRSEYAAKLAAAFGIPLEVLLSDDITSALSRHQSGYTPNVTPLSPKAKVPLISWVQAGELSDVFDLFGPGEAVHWEDAVESKPSRHGYALLVEGDSMVSTMGGHSFPPGTVLIVDPERQAVANNYVIAKDVSTQRATFKQLVTDGARWYLKALNAQYPTIQIDHPDLCVIGVVLEAKPPSLKLA